MVRAVSAVGLYEALKAEGFLLPANCRDVELLSPLDGAYMLRYEVFLEPEDLEQLGRALIRIAEANRA
jgi:hypothetical protein